MGCAYCNQAMEEKGKAVVRRTEVGRYIEERGRRPLRIRKGNYVLIREGELGEFYQVEGKIGEGGGQVPTGVYTRRPTYASASLEPSKLSTARVSH